MRQAKAEPTREHKGSSRKKQPLVDDELFRSAFHNSPAMQSVVRAADGIIVEVNTTFLQKMCRTREQVIGKTPIDLASWVEPEKLLAYRQRLESEGQVTGQEVRLRGNDGKILTVLLSS